MSAIKKSLQSIITISEKELDQFEKEVDLLKKLRNRYIIQYYEVYRDDSSLMIIMELAENGSLKSFIEENQDKSHDWKTNYSFIRNITKGLQYLHSNSIIHRDLKSLNILISEGMIAKISDFGLSKAIDDLNSLRSNNNGLVGTFRWMAPELITKRGEKHTFESDIYSLGMIIWEICAKQTKPFKDLKTNNEISLNYTQGGREDIPVDSPEDLKEIIELCWLEEPEDRISLENIIGELENNNHKYNNNDNSRLIQVELGDNTW